MSIEQMAKKRKPGDMIVSRKTVGLNITKRKKETKKHFIQEMRDQMKKISWTTQEELYTCGKVVIGAIFTLGIGIYIIDLFIRFFLSEVGHLVCMIGA